MAAPRTAIVAIVLSVLIPVAAAGQAQETSRPVIWDVARDVLLDPTTYAPAVISYRGDSLGLGNIAAALCARLG